MNKRQRAQLLAYAAWARLPAQDKWGARWAATTQNALIRYVRNSLMEIYVGTSKERAILAESLAYDNTDVPEKPLSYIEEIYDLGFKHGQMAAESRKKSAARKESP